jgi:hypothetical protein
MFQHFFLQTNGKVSEFEEIETHMSEATKRFEQVMKAEDDSTVQNVPEMYLEPIRVSFTEPDFSILDPKPSKPARPEVRGF